LTDAVGEGDEIPIVQLGLRFEVLAIPGHTRAHIAYYGANSVFCGDTLFACGCGRLFEGTAQQMADSLAKLAALPEETLVYSGHEYTLANIDFAKAVEPGNEVLLERAVSDAEKRERDRPTLPSTIGREKKTNPFLRCSQPAVIASANKYLGARASGPVAVFAAIRQWKDRF
jgi:hydroxyacylglutathione hydrolase